MSQTEAEPTQFDLLKRAFQAFFSCHHGPMPGKVVTYSDATQLADVEPVVLVFLDGEFTRLPVLRSVQVAFPGNGRANVMTWPILPGDFVGLIPQGADIGQWKASGVENQSVGVSQRRFALSDVIAYPAPRPGNSPLAATFFDSSATTLNCPTLKVGDATADKALARADLANTRMDNIETFLGAHQHTETGATTTPPIGSPPVGADIDSAKVFTNDV